MQKDFRSLENLSHLKYSLLLPSFNGIICFLFWSCTVEIQRNQQEGRIYFLKAVEKRLALQG